MGKGRLLLTFLVVLGLICAAWFALTPRGEVAPEPPAGSPPDEDPPAPEVPSAPENPGVELSGLVFDAATRKPVPGAVVTFDGAAGTTNALGRWTVALPRPRSTERPEARGVIQAAGYVQHPVRVRLPWGEPAVGVSPAYLRPILARVSGVVKFADGRLVAGARVEGHVTGEDGRYGPIAVGAGTTRLTASLDGHPVGQSSVQVPEGEALDLTVDIWIPESTPFTGTIRTDDGEPLAGASVRIGAGATTTGEDGTFSIPGVSGSRTQIDFRCDGWRPFRRWIVAGVPLECRVVRGGVLDGVVHDADGEPVGSGYEVHLIGRYDSVEMYRASTSAEGGFRMTLPVGGPVEISVMRHDRPCGSFVVTVKPGEVTTGGFTLRPAESLAVRVVSAETKAPVPDVEIFGGWPEPVTTRTDALGGAELPFPPRTLANMSLRLVVEHPEFLAQRISVPSLKYLPGEVRVIELLPRGRIRATVLDGRDRPVAGASVTVSRRDNGPSFTSYSGPDGRADVTAPRGRLVAVIASHPTLGSVHVNATAPAEVTLRLTGGARPGTKRIVVLDDEGNPLSGARVRSQGLSPRATDDTGRVEVPAHVDWLHVTAPGRVTTLLDVEDAEADSEVSVRLGPGRDVEVVVVDEKGRGVMDVNPRVTDEVDRGLPCPIPRTDGMGRAVLLGMPDRLPLLVSVGRHGFADARAWVPRDATSVKLVMPRNGVIRVRLEAPRSAGQPYRFRCRTTDRGPLLEETGGGKEGRIPDASGVLRFEAPPGRVSAMFSCAGAAPRVWNGVDVPAGGEVEVVYDFPEPGKLDVRVRDHEDGYVEGARVFLDGIATHVGWTTSRGALPPDKRKALPVGLVRLFILAEGRPTVRTDRIDLSAPEPLEVRVPSGSVADGVVLGPAGRGVHARVRVLTEIDRPAGWTTSDREGRFRLDRPLAPGEHRVAVRAPGFRPRIVTVRIGDEPKTTLSLSVD